MKVDFGYIHSFVPKIILARGTAGQAETKAYGDHIRPLPFGAKAVVVEAGTTHPPAGVGSPRINPWEDVTTPREVINFMTVGKVHTTKKYRRYRQFQPTECDPRSYRIKSVSSKTKLVVCCPKGHWNPKTKRCEIGTKVQSILKKRKPTT